MVLSYRGAWYNIFLFNRDNKMKPIKDLTGKIFDRLTVIKQSDFRKSGRIAWDCNCSCGNKLSVLSKDLVRLHTRSCGCLNKEIIIKRCTTHGQSKRLNTTKTYYTWAGMIKRCSNEKEENYSCYGGRGISVCDEWLTFDGFYRDMGDKPINCELDRIDNEMGYSKENCRWISHIKNCNNQRKTNLIEFNGETKGLSEWARIVGLTQPTLWKRIYKSKWSIEKALNYDIQGR